MLSAQRVLECYFLETRSMLLEIAATLDRYDAARGRGDGGAGGDDRLEKIHEALGVLADRATPPNRAERLLRLFSDPLD